MKKTGFVLLIVLFAACKKEKKQEAQAFEEMDYSDNTSAANYSITSLAGCGSSPSYTQAAKYEHHFPVLSGDGQTLVYIRADSGSVSNTAQLMVYGFSVNSGRSIWNNAHKNFKPAYSSSGKLLFVSDDSTLYRCANVSLIQLEGVKFGTKENAVWKNNEERFCVGGSPLELYDHHSPAQITDTTYFIKEPYLWNYDMIYGGNAAGDFVSYNVATKQKTVLNTQNLKFIYLDNRSGKLYFTKDNGIGNLDDLISYVISSGTFTTEKQFHDSFVLGSGTSNRYGSVMSSVRYSTGSSGNCNILYRNDIILMNADGSGISKVNLP